MAVINQTIPIFKNYPDYKVNCAVHAQIYDQEGDLAYKYNPFRNVQASDGKLKDFETKDLNFKLTHPVTIDVQPSYDGSVNLILNDDLNPPRIVNSRFTVVEDKRFNIIDRKGDNDTNIYHEERIDLDTRLFKNSNSIPYIDFHGLQEGGNLKAGNYIFYFKYVDADGNESDIIAESSIISVHEGGVDDPKSISGGILNTNCNKIIKLSISNLDTTHDYLNVYYTRTTGEDSYSKVCEYNKILEKKILSGKIVNLTITGFENVVSIDPSLLNVEYNIVNNVKTQTQVQNMLFFGNVDKPTIPYKDLTDLSLRIIPGVDNPNNIGMLNELYNPVDGNMDKIEYYNMKNVYYHTGYWNNEIYKLGIVYILMDDSLSPVFNIRGCNYLGSSIKMNEDIDLFQTEIINDQKVYKTDRNGNKIRNYITLSEDGLLKEGTAPLENIKGVVRLSYDKEIIKTNASIKGLYPLALTFNINDEVINEIKKFAKGFFFVRQKRIPTILGQGLTIGIDKESYLPCLKNSSNNFVMESFFDTDRILTNDFARHLLKSNDYENNVEFNAILSPELMINKLVSNGIFNNSEFTISNGFIDNEIDSLSDIGRSFSISSYINKKPLSNVYTKNKMVMVEDSAPLKSTGNKYFSATAGMAEEAFRFKYFSVKNKDSKAKNLIRGNFTGYIGCDQILPAHKIVNIHIPGYSQNLIDEYFRVRFNSFSAYYAISDRYDINLLLNDNYRSSITKNELSRTFTEYRGDCFINTVTVRMNRNFSDPEVPLNDDILDVNTWKNNYALASDGSEKDTAKINRGDVNAVQLGHWVTFKVCSTFNLALRSLDNTNTGEYALLGKPRGFYPIQEKSTRAESKMPESLLYNLGFTTTTSEKEHIELPDVPYIKNIFDNRIMYSQKHVNDAFQNGYRVFQGLQYQDITRQYGAIVKILDWQGSLLVIFENGIALLPINERALIQTETDQSIHMYGAGVLPDKETPVSVDYGSRWIESIIRTPLGVYGVDTEAKKIWRFSPQSGGLEMISDLKIGKFLNDHIHFDNADNKPLIGLRNVKAHYDNFKGDVIFTFYDCTRNENINFNLIYNERINKWVTRTTWTPLFSENINNNFITFDKDRAFEVALNAYSLKDADISEGVVLSNNQQNADGSFGELSIKNYNYYDKYQKTYTFKDLNGNDIDLSLNNNILTGSLINEPIIIQVIVKMNLTTESGIINAPDFIDYIYLKPQNFEAFPDNNLYKHGYAALFENTDNPLPTHWYGKQHAFEFEFIVNDKFSVQKIFDNLKIISNKAEPDSIEVWVSGDSYDFENDGITSKQLIKDITKVGRVRGNAHYKENIWNIEIKPFISPNKKQTRLRDKYAKIKIKYKGDKLAIITLLQTLYTISYA